MEIKTMKRLRENGTWDKKGILESSWSLFCYCATMIGLALSLCFSLFFFFFRKLPMSVYIINTEGALRRPMTYDNQSHAIHLPIRHIARNELNRPKIDLSWPSMTYNALRYLELWLALRLSLMWPGQQGSLEHELFALSMASDHMYLISTMKLIYNVGNRKVIEDNWTRAGVLLDKTLKDISLIVLQHILTADFTAFSTRK